MGLLDNLLTLHRVDTQVRALRGRLDSAKNLLEQQERTLGVLARQRTDLETQEKQLRASAHALEVEQKAAVERVEKLRGELNLSTNDKQYKAILNELKVLEAQRDDLVKRELEEVGRADETRKRLETHLATIAERVKVRDHAKGKLDEVERDIGERLAELERERGKASDALPERERMNFDRISDLTGGESMAEVTIVDLRHREFACGECNMEVPFETYAKLASTSEVLIQCKSCARILHLAEANRPVDKNEKADKADKAKFEKTRKL
jgi:predicted  nucleic acid-binding Zn-ribbon protein